VPWLPELSIGPIVSKPYVFPTAAMRVLKSKGKIHEILNEKGNWLVAFLQHDGIFHTDDPALQERIREAHQDGREISFTFDRNLTIISIDKAAAAK
jgi:hypothetical protein